MQKRIDGRNDYEMRPLRIAIGTSPYAEGSAEVQLGSTKILITATVDPQQKAPTSKEEGPRIYASLSMLPRAMHVRVTDPELVEVIKQELQGLQHLMLRALRSAVKAEEIAGISVTIECSIVCSDAGIGAAAIAGGWAALYQALRWAALSKYIRPDFSITKIAAVPGGIVNGRVIIDLCAEEAALSDFTGSFVFDEQMHLVDVRGTREGKAVEAPAFVALLNAAMAAVPAVLKEQDRAAREIP